MKKRESGVVFMFSWNWMLRFLIRKGMAPKTEPWGTPQLIVEAMIPLLNLFK